MKYYLIAGEASGDLHGSNLIKSICKNDTQAEFRAWGGDLMQQAGASLVKHYRDLAFMGFIEVILHLRTILGNIEFCKKDLLEYQPHVLILIDYPGFNMRIAQFAKQHGIKVVYYISPQVWAWKKNRVFKLKRDVDRMLTILPFEKDFYAQYNVQVDFVGHPLLDAIADRSQFDKQARLEEWGLKLNGQPIIALLPGSRKQEIKMILPAMLKAAEGQDYQLVLAGAPGMDISFYKPFLDHSQVKFISNRTYELLEIADAALVASGTATLETALFGVPEVVCYKGSAISVMIAKWLVNIKYISLVNLIMDQELVKELIQEDCKPKNIAKELSYCLSEEGKANFKMAFSELRQKLGGPGASDNAAAIIQKELL